VTLLVGERDPALVEILRQKIQQVEDPILREKMNGILTRVVDASDASHQVWQTLRFSSSASFQQYEMGPGEVSRGDELVFAQSFPEHEKMPAINRVDGVDFDKFVTEFGAWIAVLRPLTRLDGNGRLTTQEEKLVEQGRETAQEILSARKFARRVRFLDLLRRLGGNANGQNEPIAQDEADWIRCTRRLIGDEVLIEASSDLEFPFSGFSDAPRDGGEAAVKRPLI